MNINLTISELSILESAMEYAIEQYADSNGDIDPCCLIDVRDADRIGQYVDGKRIMNDVLDKISAMLDTSSKNTTEEPTMPPLELFVENSITQEVLSKVYTPDEQQLLMSLENFISGALQGNPHAKSWTQFHVNTVPTLDEFLSKCTACGGNWTAMFLSGIKAVDPWLFERLPDITFEFDEVCWISNYLIDERKDRRFKYEVSSSGKRVWSWEHDTPHYRGLMPDEEHMSIRDLFCKLNNMSEAEYEAYIK